jgi:hypothetical protein
MRIATEFSMFSAARPHGLPYVTTRGGRLIAALWRKLTTRLRNGYRPERHYMRGPGPKWHERNSANSNSDGSGATARQQLGVLNG